MQYLSSITFLGIPAVHIAVGRIPGSGPGRGVAKGWIAIGDVAIGAVAIGGVAIGGLSVGGISLGVIAIAGVSAGVWSLGGLALALFAVGGASFGLYAATGGLAIATEYALGGVAVASHANDEAARAYFSTGRFFRYADSLLPYLHWLFAVVVGVVAAVWAFGRGKKERASGG
jgi:hypothetical protein